MESVEMFELNKIPMDELIFILHKLHRLLDYDENLESQIFFSIKFDGFPTSISEEKVNELRILFSK